MLESYATVWEAIADAIPDADALIQGDRHISWAAFDDRAARLASVLTSFGVGEGTPVVLLLHNGSAYVEVLAACLKLRAVPTGVNPRCGPMDLLHQFRDSGARLLVCHRSLEGLITFAIPQLLVVDDVGDGAGARRSEGTLDAERLIASHDPAARIPRPGTDHLLWYTGGTTGMSKGALWEQQTLLTFELGYGAGLLGGEPATTLDELGHAAAVRHATGRRLVTLVTTPLAHATAANQLHLTLSLGGTLVMLPPGHVDGDQICRTVEREHVRVLSVVGDAVLRRVVDALEHAARRGTPYDLSSLQRVHSSGTMTRSATKDALHAHLPAVELYDSLGATEGVGFAIALTRHGDHAETGRFRLGPNARVLDADDHDVVPGSGEAGILAVATSTAVGYHGDPERTAATFREVDGVRYAVLGDSAIPHADGTITLLGRGSQCINTGGEKVWPEEVEEVLATHPDVIDVAVVGVPDDEWGEIVGAVVATRGRADDAGAEELRAWVGARIARYKRPRLVEFVDEVQRTAVGKPDREWARTRLT